MHTQEYKLMPLASEWWWPLWKLTATPSGPLVCGQTSVFLGQLTMSAILQAAVNPIHLAPGPLVT